MTTLAAYCQGMGWNLNDPAVREKVQAAVGNISDDTELQEYQMDALMEAKEKARQDSIQNALGAQKPGDDPMVDAFGGTRKGNGDLQFKSHQDLHDYLSTTTITQKSSTKTRNDLAKRWQKANGFMESAEVVLDMIANAGAYMPWNWNK